MVFLRQKQLALRWGISERSLERWRAKGSGPRFVRITRGVIVYRLTEIEAYEAERTIPAEAKQ